MTVRGPAGDEPLWCDGERGRASEFTVTVDDPAFLSGVGVFETLGTRCGLTLDLDEHLERMAEGARVLEIAAPPAAEIGSCIAAAAGEVADADCGWVKVVLAGSGRWFVFCGRLPADERDAPISAVLLPWRRSLDDPIRGIKSLCYASHTMGLRHARGRGADEGVWLNSRGHVAEGCASNLFVVHRGALHTASERDGILPGIVRDRVLATARCQGIRVHVGKTRLFRLEHAREAFVTSSVRGIRPLVRFDGRAVGTGRPGPVTRRLAEAVEQARISAAGVPT